MLVPHEGQNAAPSSTEVPQFAQNAIVNPLFTPLAPPEAAGGELMQVSMKLPGILTFL
jgi:hypothetical protein